MKFTPLMTTKALDKLAGNLETLQARVKDERIREHINNAKRELIQALEKSAAT